MRCNIYSCYWNGGGRCVCELHVAPLKPNTTECPNYEEDQEDD